MCGIAGKVAHDRAERVSEEDIRRMIAPIAHRGPDGNGVYLDRNAGLGHCRLSIIDLSAGAQPMTNEDGTVWIVFNGEIYNFQELHDRLQAKGHVFRSRCDTEVIIHLYEDLGPECVKELRGMFAFAIWDTKSQSLFVARDRVGIKPLYFCQTDRAFWFASELKAVIADPEVSREMNPRALRMFLSFNYVPGEETLFRSVRKLLPGHWLLVKNGCITTRQYWDLQFTQDRWNQPYNDAVEELHQLIAGSVRDHMIADVPVGVLLSGGVDSSAVLNFAVQGTGKKVKTFTVGFDGDQVVDERPYARLAAQRFQTEHFETSISADDFWNFLPAYVRHMEEPVCEPPAVALYYVTKLARDHVKVLLSGEGGDEAFAGYPNYPNMLRLERLQMALGPLARPAGLLAGLAGRISGEARLQRYAGALGRPLASHYFSRTSSPSAFFNRSAGALVQEELINGVPHDLARQHIESLTRNVANESLLNQMLYVDSKTWLPDDLLIKADKITMANSLELRVPLLDHKILEFAASLPADFKVRGRETKRILKSAFSKVLPAEVIERKKAGFPVPYENWLSRRLKQQVEDVLLSSQAISRGYFQPRAVERLLQDNARGGRHAKEIFSLIAVELWHREFADASAFSAAPETSSVVGLASARGSEADLAANCKGIQ
ncbi:MAG: asparagine synthase (glutamine-hydrolyzing) [Verrucomicrobiota bacterium]